MYAHIHGYELFYTLSGQGRPMLLMHGGSGLDHTQFRPWLDPLGDRVQLIYYDQLGQGRSTRPASYDEIGIDTWAQEADTLRASLGHDKVILFGYSFGGFIAQEYALHFGDHLDGLILCDTAPVLDYPEIIMSNAQHRGTQEQVQAVIRVLSTPSADDADFQQTWMTILPLYFNRYDPNVGVAMDTATHYSAAAYNQGMGKALPAFNTLSRLSEITVPTLVIAGRHDWITPPAQGAERIHTEIAHSQLVVFEESGHFPYIEENEHFVKTVSDWIATLK